ncbi:MAG: 50S ribosomal protein L3 N(5)-glutamine methyltransferase [Aquabacterium sp.]|nr:50S ribosomal protein L3 N(5)-glutamine methyltransferase [Aquabacterium sp.]
MNVMELIEASCARLNEAGVSFGQGTTNAFDEAAWLVLWRLQMPLDALDDVAELDVDDAHLDAVDSLIDQRITSRQPAAYLTGEAWLQGVPFTVDARCIIPRSLIAEPLAEGSIDAWLSDGTRHVLDLCTGNGSLAVLAAIAWPEVAVDAADLSTDALAVAQINIDRHQLAGRITLHPGDGLAAVANRVYDLILCNPPYVNQASMAALPAEFRAEPALALAGGADGMDFIRRLLAQAAQHLTPDGVLVLEIGHERPHFDAAFPTLDVVWLPTSAGDDQVLLATRTALLYLPTPQRPSP